MLKWISLNRFRIMLCCLSFSLICFTGCTSHSRVSYEGGIFPETDTAILVRETQEVLLDQGYEQIGTFISEPTTHGLSVSKEEYSKDPQAVLDSIAAENCEQFNDYYASLDKEVCFEAAKVGGQKVRLEKVLHSYPEFREDIAALMEEAMAEGLTMKAVVSTKEWSGWKKK